MALEPSPFEGEAADRAKAGSSLAAARHALLGGPDARERLAEADEAALGEERRRDLCGHMTFAVMFVLWISWTWSDSVSDLWNLVWFLPLAFFGVLVWYHAARLFNSLGDSTTDLFDVHTYSPDRYGDDEDDDPDFDLAEIAGATAGIPDGAAPAMVPDSAWSPPPGIWVKPRGDWGFVDTIDGELAGPFEVQIEESGVTLFDGRRGWRGRIRSARHKYGYMDFTMRPRHTPFDGIVSIDVNNGGPAIFSGVADTSGLECDWL